MNLAGNTETVFVVRIYSVRTFVTISKIPDVWQNVIHKWDRLCGSERNSLDYAGFAQLCGRSPWIMRKIMHTHNRIIQWSQASCYHDWYISLLAATTSNTFSQRMQFLLLNAENTKTVYFSKQMRQCNNEVFGEFGLVVRNLLYFLCRRPAARWAATNWIFTSSCLFDAADHYLNQTGLLSVVQR